MVRQNKKDSSEEFFRWKKGTYVFGFFCFTLLMTVNVDAKLYGGTDTLFKEEPGLRFEINTIPHATKNPTDDNFDFRYSNGSCPTVVGANCMEFNSDMGLYLADKPADSLRNGTLNLNDTSLFTSGFEADRNQRKFAFHDYGMWNLSYDTYEKNAMVCKTYDSNYVLLSIKHFGGKAIYTYDTFVMPDGTKSGRYTQSITRDTLIVTWILQTNKTVDFRGSTGIVNLSGKNCIKFTNYTKPRQFLINGKEIEKNSMKSGMPHTYIDFDNMRSTYKLNTKCLRYEK